MTVIVLIPITVIAISAVARRETVRGIIADANDSARCHSIRGTWDVRSRDENRFGIALGSFPVAKYPRQIPFGTSVDISRKQFEQFSRRLCLALLRAFLVSRRNFETWKRERRLEPSDKEKQINSPILERPLYKYYSHQYRTPRVLF